MNGWILVAGVSLIFSISLPAQQGCIRGDCHQGYGTWVFENGSVYSGDFMDGYFHGLGIYETPAGEKYSGNWIRHKRAGKGRLNFPNGDLYFGDFKSGKMSGLGEMWFNNGDYYAGNWEGNLPEGKGIFVEENGFLYRGDWKSGLRHGRGQYVSPSGDSVSGQWFNGFYWEIFRPFVFADAEKPLPDCNRQHCASGEGEYQYTDGTIYRGLFREGQPLGSSHVLFSDGSQYWGYWKDDHPEGMGVMQTATGRWKGGRWKMGSLLQPFYPKSLVNRQVQAKNSHTTNKQVSIYAVVVGAADYEYMPRLEYADDDARRLCSFLKSPSGGALEDSHIRLLVDGEASLRAIVKAMEEVFGKAGNNDMILFYFSGHGVQGAFIPIDSDGWQNRLEHNLIKDMVASSRAKYKLVIADECHSGGLLAYQQGPELEAFLEKFYASFEGVAGGLALLMSSKDKEYSLEDGRLRSGVFSHFLIEGLSGAADVDNSGIVTIGELADFVSIRVPYHTGRLQTPVLTGNYDRYMPVAAVAN